MKQRRTRKALYGGLCALLAFCVASGCGALRTARIRKDVTLNTHRQADFRIEPPAVIAVVPPIRKDELAGISLTISEAAQDMMSLQLWNAGYRIIDKIFIKEVLARETIAFENFSVEQAVRLGEAVDSDYVMLVSLNDFEEDVRSIDFGPFHVVNTVDTSVLVGLNCRLVDVTARRVVWSGVATTQDKNLQLSLRRISRHLIASLQNGTTRPRDRTIPGIGMHF
jgi:hypothetical protein